MSRLKTALKTVLRYALLGAAIYAAGYSLIVIYVHQTGKAAREFCEEVETGMSAGKLRSLAAKKGLELKRDGLESDDDGQYVFQTGPNRESRCTVVVRGGHVTGKKHIQTL